MTPLCFIDTETTGVHPERLAWEIAMIRRDDGGQRELSFFVEVDLSAADPFGLKVGHFYERHPAYDERSSQPCFRESRAAELVEQWTRGAHLVGAVPDFDARTLDPMLRRHGFLPAWHYHLIDVEAMAAGWLNAPGSQRRLAERQLQPPWKSDDLSRACGVEPPDDAERHTALGDARWAMRWYDAMVGAA